MYCVGLPVTTRGAYIVGHKPDGIDLGWYALLWDRERKRPGKKRRGRAKTSIGMPMLTPRITESRERLRASRDPMHQSAEISTDALARAVASQIEHEVRVRQPETFGDMRRTMNSLSATRTLHSVSSKLSMLSMLLDDS